MIFVSSCSNRFPPCKYVYRNGSVCAQFLFRIVTRTAQLWSASDFYNAKASVASALYKRGPVPSPAHSAHVVSTLVRPKDDASYLYHSTSVASQYHSSLPIASVLITMKTADKLPIKRPNGHPQSAKTATLGNIVSPMSRIRNQMVLGGNRGTPSKADTSSISTANNGTSGSNIRKLTKAPLRRLSGFGPNKNAVHQAAPRPTQSPGSVPFHSGRTTHSTTPTSNLSAAVTEALKGTAGVGLTASRTQRFERAERAETPNVPQIIMPALAPASDVAPPPNGDTRPSTPEPEPLPHDHENGVLPQQVSSTIQEADTSFPAASICLAEGSSRAPAETSVLPPPADQHQQVNDLGEQRDHFDSSIPFAGGLSNPGPSYELGCRGMETTLPPAYSSAVYAPWHQSSTTAAYTPSRENAPQQEVGMELEDPPVNIFQPSVYYAETTQMPREMSFCSDMDVSMNLDDSPVNQVSMSSPQWDVPSSNSTSQIHTPVDNAPSATPCFTPVYQPEQYNHVGYSHVDVAQTSASLYYEPMPNVYPHHLHGPNVPHYPSEAQVYFQGTTDNALPRNTVQNTASLTFCIAPANSWQSTSTPQPVSFIAQPAFPTHPVLLQSSELSPAPETFSAFPASSTVRTDFPASDQTAPQQGQNDVRGADPDTPLDVNVTPSVPQYQRSSDSSAGPSTISSSNTKSGAIRHRSTSSSSAGTGAGAHRAVNRALPEILSLPAYHDFTVKIGKDALTARRSAPRFCYPLPRRGPSTMVFRAPDAHISTRNYLPVPDRNPRVKPVREATAATSQSTKRSRAVSYLSDEENPSKRRRTLESSVTPTRSTRANRRVSRSSPQKSQPRSARCCTDLIGSLVRHMVRTWW
ncbi:hypothetical protein LshimejAT787_1102010 [Lyophyllum shimeji]|uniref:Uncharacterized protein n=1 Tax=Lyophyllum shimeji TaxID=47721 RepID=A0A9P3PV15_LYOSH|nr:hypothetical protein LshimejAT787_1102010 [Lyophyllum shimeji]